MHYKCVTSVIKTFKKLLYRKIFECAVDRALIKYECGMLHFRGGGHMGVGGWVVVNIKTFKNSQSFKNNQRSKTYKVCTAQLLNY